jgi:hypothetical protein
VTVKQELLAVAVFGLVVSGLASLAWCPDEGTPRPVAVPHVSKPDAGLPASLMVYNTPAGDTNFSATLWESHDWHTVMTVSADVVITFDDGKQHPECESAVRAMRDALDQCGKDRRELVEQLAEMRTP